MAKSHPADLMASELRDAFHAQAAREAVRAKAHEREQSHYRGVAWSGLSPGAFAARDAAALLGDARRELAGQRAWRARPSGAFLSAMADAQAASAAAHRAGEAARAAAARNFEGELDLCRNAAQEMRRHARLALAAARRAALLASRASGGTS